MAEGHDDRCANQRRSLPASCSPLSSRSCSSTQTWLPVGSPVPPPWDDPLTGQDEARRDRRIGMQLSECPSPQSYEELSCTRRACSPLAPLVGTFMTSSGPQSDVVKQGYLGKLDRNHRRYFVLRAGSHTGPSRLEWYKNQEKFTATEKSAGKAAMFSSSKQGVVYLRCCLGASRLGSSWKGHMVALYAKDQTLMVVMEDQREQEDWYLAIKKLMEEEQKDEEHGDGADEEDDGYCTLSPSAFFKEVWPVTVKPRGLGSSKSLTGESRLCLTATSLILVRVCARNDLPSVSIPLLSVRRFGHSDGLFFLELGRSAPNGPGEIWMEARDHGNPALAQHIHEVVREMVRTLQALPDFSRSPTSSHSHTHILLASKRCRPKYRDKPVNVRPPGPQALLPRNHDMQTSPAQCDLRPCKPDHTNPESTLSFTSRLSPSRAQQSAVPEPGSYMEMKTDQCSGRVCEVQGREPEEEEEVPGYMIMSPQVSPSTSVLSQDDYVTMVSPHKPNRPAHSISSSSLQTSLNSSTANSPLHPSRHRTDEHSPQRWLVTSVQRSGTEADQSQMSIGCSARAQDDARQQEQPAQTRASSGPGRSVDGCGLMTTSRPDCTRPQRRAESLNSHPGRFSRLIVVPHQFAVRRTWLSSCLPSCLRAKDRS
ncbi:insulin receptor substrate 2-like [Embiotoca jacksoni]|uniref:insulin receptor substrate 2-like n=1 Tax=Embiotoca jacksoni TaxID=100190 RepID=UPI0037039048